MTGDDTPTNDHVIMSASWTRNVARTSNPTNGGDIDGHLTDTDMSVLPPSNVQIFPGYGKSSIEPSHSRLPSIGALLGNLGTKPAEGSEDTVVSVEGLPSRASQVSGMETLDVATTLLVLFSSPISYGQHATRPRDSKSQGSEFPQGLGVPQTPQTTTLSTNVEPSLHSPLPQTAFTTILVESRLPQCPIGTDQIIPVLVDTTIASNATYRKRERNAHASRKLRQFGKDMSEQTEEAHGRPHRDGECSPQTAAQAATKRANCNKAGQRYRQKKKDRVKTLENDVATLRDELKYWKSVARANGYNVEKQ